MNLYRRPELNIIYYSLEDECFWFYLEYLHEGSPYPFEIDKNYERL